MWSWIWLAHRATVCERSGPHQGRPCSAFLLLNSLPWWGGAARPWLYTSGMEGRVPGLRCLETYVVEWACDPDCWSRNPHSQPYPSRPSPGSTSSSGSWMQWDWAHIRNRCSVRAGSCRDQCPAPPAAQPEKGPYWLQERKVYGRLWACQRAPEVGLRWCPSSGARKTGINFNCHL